MYKSPDSHNEFLTAQIVGKTFTCGHEWNRVRVYIHIYITLVADENDEKRRAERDKRTCLEKILLVRGEKIRSQEMNRRGGPSSESKDTPTP